MAIAIDLAVMAIILLSTFLGYKKGLIGVVFKILSFIIAIIITLILYRPISHYIIQNTQIATNIEEAITQKLSLVNIEDGKIQTQNTNLPVVLVNYINGEITNTVEQTKEAVIQELAKQLTETAINIIVTLAIFIIAKLILLCAKVLLEAVANLPLIKQFNEAGGIIYGIARGIMIVYIGLAILSLILPMLNKTAVLSAINSTSLTSMLYNNNLILMLFFK